MNNKILFVLFDYVAMNGVFMLCYFYLIVCAESHVFWLREKGTIFDYQKGKWHTLTNVLDFIHAP
jgi:hypothetical protein